MASALLASFGCETQSTKESTKTEVSIDHEDSGDVDVIGKIGVDNTNKETGEAKTDFQPRKFTEVKSLDTSRKTQNINEVHIEKMVTSPERDYEVLGGIPAIEYDETTRGEVNIKENINIKEDSIETKDPWLQRIFRRK